MTPPATRALVVAVVVALAVLAGTGTAGATFRRTVTASTTATSAVLQPVTNLANGSSNCLLATRTVRVTWTASTSAYRTGYRVVVSGSASTTADVGPTATSAQLNGTNLLSGPYTFTVTTLYRNWTSATRSVSFTC